MSKRTRPLGKFHFSVSFRRERCSSFLYFLFLLVYFNASGKGEDKVVPMIN
jgi:hypothetical protein